MAEGTAEVAAAIGDADLAAAAAAAAAADVIEGVADAEVAAATVAVAIADHAALDQHSRRGGACSASFAWVQSGLTCVQLRLCLPNFCAISPSGC